MEENQIIAPAEEPSVELTNKPRAAEPKPIHAAALVMGILSIVFGILFAIVGDVLSIIGIVLSVVNRKKYRTKASLVCSIIGLVLSIANHLFTLFVLAQVAAQL